MLRHYCHYVFFAFDIIFISFIGYWLYFRFQLIFSITMIFFTDFLRCWYFHAFAIIFIWYAIAFRLPAFFRFIDTDCHCRFIALRHIDFHTFSYYSHSFDTFLHIFTFSFLSQIFCHYYFHIIFFSPFSFHIAIFAIIFYFLRHSHLLFHFAISRLPAIAFSIDAISPYFSAAFRYHFPPLFLHISLLYFITPDFFSFLHWFIFIISFHMMISDFHFTLS